MQAQATLPVNELDQRESSRNWKVWLAVLGLALLIHLLFLLLNPHWSTVAPPPRVEIQQVDPRKLDAIRRQWKQREKSILLNQDESKPQDTSANPDARYMSDRTRRVEKEQKARQTQVIPKPGSQAQNQPQSQPQQKTKAPSRPIKLGNLGVPFKLAPQNPAQAQAQNRPMQRGISGGDQAVLDRDLQEGDQNILNTEQSVYYSFYARMYQSIGPIWESKIRDVPRQRRVSQGDYTTLADVVFDDAGNLIAVNIVQSSGIPEFDNAVTQAWNQNGRVPNPPHGLLDQNNQVHTGWTFNVRVGEGFNLEYAPPERNY